MAADSLAGARIAVLAAISHPIPPSGYAPWETVAFNIAEGLRLRGYEVTLFASGDSRFQGKLEYAAPVAFSTDPALDTEVFSSLHIAKLFSKIDRFDLVHNNLDWRPLLYALSSREPVLLTTVHGFSSPQILAAYYAAADRSFFCSISNADRDPGLPYLATVYNGIDPTLFTFQEAPGTYLLFFGRIHEEKGVHHAIEVALRAKRPLILAGIIHDAEYFRQVIEPHIDNVNVRFVGEARGQERNRLLGGAQALLQLVTRPERFGLSMIEAMACGTPVIGSDLGSIPEVVVDRVTGFVCKDNDEAVRSIQHLQEIDRRACRRHVERYFTIDCMVEGYLEAYARALSLKRPTSDASHLQARSMNWWDRPQAFTDIPEVPTSAKDGIFPVDAFYD